MESCEPGQVRKEAALSGHLQARWERRTGVIRRRSRPGYGIDGGCTVRFSGRRAAGGRAERGKSLVPPEVWREVALSRAFRAQASEGGRGLARCARWKPGHRRAKAGEMG